MTSGPTLHVVSYSFFFFFNDTATTEIYTLSLHDALPISSSGPRERSTGIRGPTGIAGQWFGIKLILMIGSVYGRSEEHTSELQSRLHLVCRLLLEKKKNALRQSILVYSARTDTRSSRANA